MPPLFLQLDIAGNPVRWITYKTCAYYYSKNLIAWTAGEHDYTIYGGINRVHHRSQLTMNTIIAVKGKISFKGNISNEYVSLSNRTLFERDRNLCAYCGKQFSFHNLTRDHIVPISRNGTNTWMNVVTACAPCNKYKDDRTPEEANMELLYVPYVPSRAEFLLLSNKKILADQMSFLLNRIPDHSRLKYDTTI